MYVCARASSFHLPSVCAAMSLARGYQAVRLLRPATSLSPKTSSGRAESRGGVQCREIFGKVTGKSHSKVLSSPADGIAQIEGERSG